MKCRILSIIALFAVMAVLTGIASASSIDLVRQGHILGNPTQVKNGDSFIVDALVTAIRPADLTSSNIISAVLTGCTDQHPPGTPVPIPRICQLQDINLSVLAPNFIVTTQPSQTQSDAVSITVNAPLSRKAGTEYGYVIQVDPFTGNPPGSLSPNPASASRSFQLIGGNISGAKFNDINGDGIRGAAEPGLANWIIILRDENGTEIANTTTGPDGKYEFKGEFGFRGNFTVEEVLQPDWNQTAPNPSTPAPTGAVVVGRTWKVTIDANDVTGLDFGNFQRPSTKLTKEANPTQSDNVPTTVNYTYKETNDGFVPLTNASVEDDNCSPVTYQSGDTNNNKILDPGETWVFTCQKTYTAAGTYTNNATAHGFTPQGVDITFPAYPAERASATVIITIPQKPGKVVGWGNIGPRASPEKTFKIFAYTLFLPKGTMEVQDNVENLNIVATQIDSVLTDMNATPKTGTIKGMATVNGAGPYAFTVHVVDAADPGADADMFTIDVSSPTPYHNSGKLSMGDVNVVK